MATSQGTQLATVRGLSLGAVPHWHTWPEGGWDTIQMQTRSREAQDLGFMLFTCVPSHLSPSGIQSKTL